MLTECRQYRQRIVELARGAAGAEDRRALLAHTESCAACAQALDGQVALSAAMQRMAADTVPEMGVIEANVLAEFDRAVSKRRFVSMRRWIAVAGVAAALLIAVILREWSPSDMTPPRKVETAVVAPVPELPPVQVSTVVPKPPRRVQPVSQHIEPKEEQPFLAIPYTVPPGPDERTTVVRMEIPVAALIAAGYTVSISDPGAVVEADVLLSQDGRARAIRPISVLASR